MKIYSPDSMMDRYTEYPKEKLEKRKKNLGNVYAIKTKKGFALGQVADIDKWNGIYLCRIFKKLYKLLPQNIDEIIQGKEDYIVQIMLPSMTRTREKSAIKLGKYDIPSHYKTPDYTKCCMAFGEKDTQVPMVDWYIIPDYMPLVEYVEKKDWVQKYLGKDLYDISWKEDFKKLNPGEMIDAEILIRRLEKKWSLESWLPRDFKKSLRYIWKREEEENEE